MKGQGQVTESDNTNIFVKLQQDFEQRGFELTSDQASLLEKYWAMVKEASQHQDLTRILEDDLAYAKHFLDCYAPYFASKEHRYDLWGSGKYCLDIGTGAGFPGIPLAILNDQKTWVLVDSRLKKIEFLERVCSELNLKNVLPIHGRAEELTRTNPELRSKVGLVTSRAIKLDEKIQKETFRLMTLGGLLVQYVGPSAEAIAFPRGHDLDVILDFKPELHPETIHHRIIIYKK